MISREVKTQLIAKHGQHKTDSGSSPVQIAILTRRIEELTGHLKTRDKDHLSRRGLLQMVGQRKRLINYLKANDYATFEKVIKEHGLRG
jgi:small subunit ribosomal protein S15